MPYNTGMITVHTSTTRVTAGVVVARGVGVAYEVKRYQRDAKTMLAPPALLAVHPLGKSPVIVDDMVTVAESGAIIEYLIDRYGGGRLIPPPAAPSGCDTPTGCTTRKDRQCRRCCSNWCSIGRERPRALAISALARGIAGTVQNSFIGRN